MGVLTPRRCLVSPSVCHLAWAGYPGQPQAQVEFPGAEEVPYGLVPAIVSEPPRCDDETRALFSTGTRFE